jgi:hypothetical protein
MIDINVGDISGDRNDGVEMKINKAPIRKVDFSNRWVASVAYCGLLCRPRVNSSSSLSSPLHSQLDSKRDCLIRSSSPLLSLTICELPARYTRKPSIYTLWIRGRHLPLQSYKVPRPQCTATGSRRTTDQAVRGGDQGCFRTREARNDISNQTPGKLRTLVYSGQQPRYPTYHYNREGQRTACAPLARCMVRSKAQL